MIKRFTNYQLPVWIKNVNKQSGFTLLEVVCSLALMSLVVVASLSFLGHSLDFWEKSGRWGHDEQVVRQVDRNMINLVDHLYCGALPHGEEKGFVGDDRSLEELSEDMNGLTRTGFYWEASEKIVYVWKNSKENRIKVAEDIDHFELSYYESGHGWVTSWDRQSPLPTHIRLVWNYQQKKEPIIMLAIVGGRSIPAP